MDILNIALLKKLEKDMTVELEKLKNNNDNSDSQYNRPITPLNYEIINKSDGGVRGVIADSWDGNLYGIIRNEGASKFYKSSDSGETFEYFFPVYDLSIVYGEIIWISVFDSGEMTMITAEGYSLYFPDYSLEEYEVALETGVPQKGRLSISSYGLNDKKMVLYGEYDHSTAMKRIWISHNSGKNYEVLKEGDTLNEGNNHWHCVVYDPYSDGIWASQGDGANLGVYYTPDYGATWHFVPGYQPTSIRCFEERVVFGHDSSTLKPGISSWERNSEPYPTKFTDVMTFREDLSADKVYPTNVLWNENSDDYYMMFKAQEEQIDKSYLFVTGNQGKDWHLVSVMSKERNEKTFSFFTGLDNNNFIFFTFGNGDLGRMKPYQWF